DLFFGELPWVDGRGGDLRLMRDQRCAGRDDDQQDHDGQQPLGGAAHYFTSLRAAARAARTRSGVNGASRSRRPVASKIALAMAAGPGTDADSPDPNGGLPLGGISTTSISGRSV